VHATKLPGFKEIKGVDDKRSNSLGIGDKVDLSAVAAVTPGLSGAELEFLVNEAAIRAVRRVSSALREGDVRVTPHVLAEDFEASLQNYFETRKPKGGVNDMLKNVWRQ
jgi:SpoVK/Ycf46/Vps4 family AAA+-type ATPase